MLPINEQEINKILEDELTKLGMKRSALTGSTAQVASGGISAKIAAKILDTQTYQQSLQLALPYDQILALLSKRFDGAAPEPLVTATARLMIFKKTTGSGFMNMNPTVLLAAVQEQGNTVIVAGYAKEGLIKQHSAEKAVKALLTSIQQPAA